MASPGYYRDESYTESGHVKIGLEWNSQAAGAVPALTSAANFPHNGAGRILSVVHGGVGVYTITFTEVWFDLIQFVGWVIQAAYSAAGACNVRVTANNTGNATPTLVLLVTNAAGAAVEPTTNDVMYVNLVMQTYQA